MMAYPAPKTRKAITLREIEAVDFRALIRPGDTVAWLGGVPEPVKLVTRLSSQAPDCSPFSVMMGQGLSEALASDSPQVAVRALGGAGTNRRFFVGGADGVVPCNMSNLCEMIGDSVIKIDVVLLQVTGPDETGRYNAGFSIQYLREAFERAAVVIAQVNNNVPWTYGDTILDPDWFDVIVHCDAPVLEVFPTSPTSIDMQIGENIRRLIADKSVIQLGIGGIPDAAIRALSDARGLGIHSGILSDGLMALMESGAADNRHKAIDQGVAVAMALHGTNKLNMFATRNMQVSIRSPRYTHNPAILAQLERLIAINSAIEVDLTGQVNAETALGRHIGMVGGQVDFVRAAMRSHHGRSIIALPATARNGTRSRIVSKLADAVVTTPRADADIIVTEYGMAELRGRTLEERVKAMISVAAPEFRAGLRSSVGSLV